MTIPLTSFSDFLKRFMSTQHTVEALAIEHPSFFTVWINSKTLDIAELGKEHIERYEDLKRERNMRNMLLRWIEEKSITEHVKYVAGEIIAEKWLHPIISDLWLKEDIVPYFKETTQQGNEVPKEYVREIANRFSGNQIVHVVLKNNNEVDPAELVTIDDYKGITPPKEFELLQTLVKSFKGKKLLFISATPQGGGVALMRHALIRLYRLLGVDAHWIVLYPLKEAFDITKQKFHNVLQAVADPSVKLTDADKSIYNSWITYNAQALEVHYKDADVVVIDDPQPAGLLPYIKKANNKGKILYRSHIQIESHLADKVGTPQHTTWEFIWSHIKDNDLFISHPMKQFVPKNVPLKTTVMMPATTDALDGLNKRLNSRNAEYYLKLFDKILLEHQETPMDTSRPYIIQIARFDPSKGIPDVIESYRILVEKLKKAGRVIPQLVITGHGSIDDPDGTPLYNLTIEMKRSARYSHLAEDIKIARLPAIDQILNVLLRESKVALQLSHKEGFEVKVSEALMKGVPIVAYKAGGIPLQVIDGVSGYLVNVGDTKQVADRLYKLFTDDELYHRMQKGAKENVNPETTTVSNAINWLFLATEILKKGKIIGNGKNVKDLIKSAKPLKQL